MTTVDPENVKQFLPSKYAAQINAMGLNGGRYPAQTERLCKTVLKAVETVGSCEVASRSETPFDMSLSQNVIQRFNDFYSRKTRVSAQPRLPYQVLE